MRRTRKVIRSTCAQQGARQRSPESLHKPVVTVDSGSEGAEIKMNRLHPMRFFPILFALVFFVYFAASAAIAQDGANQGKPAPKPAATPPPAVQPAAPVPTPAGAPLTPDAATIEKIMEQAARNIGLRYNLNQAQSEKTQEIMKREVHAFLKEHEAEVWPLIRDLMAAQLGAAPPSDPAELKRIGKGVKPLIQAAKDAILRGNEEWRMYLTPDQRKMHDFDLTEIDRSFGQINEQFSRWEKGESTEAPLFPAASAAGPQRPKKPSEGLPEPEVDVFEPRRLFDPTVEKFIRDYELDQAQNDSARSILAEFNTKGEDFKKANKDALAALAVDLKKALQERDQGLKRSAEAARKKLLTPVYALLDQLNERLKGLLTTAQIDRYEAKKKAEKEGRLTTVKKPPVAAPPPATAPPAVAQPAPSAKPHVDSEPKAEKEKPETKGASEEKTGGG